MANSKDKRSSAPTDYDPRTDPLNPLIALALAEQALPPLEEELDLDHADEALTDDDRRVLESMGSSEAVVRNALSKLDSETAAPLKSAEETMRMGSLSTTDPAPGSRFYRSESTQGRDELMERMRSFESDEHVSWPSNYRKRKELGRGGQGVVYLAESLDEFRSEHALKIFSPRPYSNERAYREDMERMTRVASLAHRLHVDNLLEVERFVNQNGIHVMLMQWIDGYDLGRLIHVDMVDRVNHYVEPIRRAELNDIIFKMPVGQQYRLQPGHAVNIVEKILRALNALHDKGIVHRDIKPSNIMLDCHGSIKLIDIGSATEISEPPRNPTWTPLYAPPEYLMRREWTEKSDMASLGYVLIELLSGRRSVLGPGGDQSTITTHDRRNGELLEAKQALPERLTEILPEQVQECTLLVNLCKRLIDPNPDRRFPKASEAIEGPDGTFSFNKQLVQGEMAGHYASHIQRWLTDVKDANQQLP